MIYLQAARLGATAGSSRKRAMTPISSPNGAAGRSRYSTRAPRLEEARPFPFRLADGIAPSDEVLRRLKENVLQASGGKLVPEQRAQALDGADKG